jgi:hypothetical protein
MKTTLPFKFLFFGAFSLVGGFHIDLVVMAVFRKSQKILCITLIFLGFSLFAEAQNSANLPKPLVSLADTGRYRSDIEKIGKLFSEKKLVRFYGEASMLYYGFNKLTEKENQSKERRAMYEWLFYYVASAPLIPIEERLHGEKIYKVVPGFSGNRIYDVDMKDSALAVLSNGFIEERAQTLGVDSRALAKLHAAYMVTIGKSLQDIKAEASEEIDKEVSLHKRLGDELKELRLFLASEKFKALSNDEQRKLRVQFRDKRRRKEQTQEYLEEWVLIHNESQSSYYKMERRLISQLVAHFPKEGAVVQQHLKTLGYDAVSSAYVLEQVVGRRKETTHLFLGLPDEKATKKFQEAQEQKNKLAENERLKKNRAKFEQVNREIERAEE